ncbi:IMV heparin binding surface protein [NY_014 poxvirus]|uniref:IMV heparin binding surface protein n=1 Tax=NY_014 poxvirus TaxID=2025360 RepID=UPI000B99FE76|nr:IMV heparin binding surface protein [NY_014 poxvirus]AST09494.1 IMV heparin binding surface protein [NY_014 poxvirus]
MEQGKKIPIVIIPVVDRPPNQTFPNYPTEDANKRLLSFSDEYVYPMADIIKQENDPNHYNDYHFATWNGGDIRKMDKYAKFFSGFCNTMCTLETKTHILKHLSLWDSSQFLELQKSKIDYVVIIENDNTIEDITFIRPVIDAMSKNKIEILQMREVMIGSRVKTELVTTKEHTIYSYSAGYDISLSAYIINVDAAIKLVNEIVKSGGVSSGFYFEIGRLENELNINRQIMEDAAKYVRHDPRLVAERRFDTMKPNFWSRIGKAMAKRFPTVMYTFTTPLISFFGLFDINVIGFILILFIMFMLIFDVRSRLLWFLTGTIVTGFI